MRRAILGVALLFSDATSAQCLSYRAIAEKLAKDYQEQMLFRGWAAAQRGQPPTTIVEIWGKRSGPRESWSVVQRKLVELGGSYRDCASITASGVTWDGQARPGFGLPGPF